MTAFAVGDSVAGGDVTASVGTGLVVGADVGTRPGTRLVPVGPAVADAPGVPLGCAAGPHATSRSTKPEAR